MPVRAVDFVLLSVSGTQRSVGFYRDTLGLAPGAEWPPHWYEFEAGGTTIAIGKPPRRRRSRRIRGSISVALAVPDARAMLEELRAKGVTVVQEVQETPVCFMGLIADPDGNLLWLHQRKDGSAG